jgi:hypothetical protein
MAVLTSKSGVFETRDPLIGEERFENEKLYRIRGCVEKQSLPLTSLFSAIYSVEKT